MYTYLCTDLEKLGFLVHESLYSSKQAQENVGPLIFCATCDFRRHMSLPHHVPSRAPNEML